MKIFDSTRYVKVEGQYKDVEPNEKYLELKIKSQWDFWDPQGKYVAYKDGFSYYVNLISKDSDSSYSFFARLNKDEMTEEYLELVSDYLKL